MRFKEIPEVLINKTIEAVIRTPHGFMIKTDDGNLFSLYVEENSDTIEIEQIC